ncbi:hypothetical protein J437_LFUL013174, partial [Ladona fulva]
MSCSDLMKPSEHKCTESGNMGDVLGKECEDGEKDELQEDEFSDEVREEADGAPSVEEQTPQPCGQPDGFEFKQADEAKGAAAVPEGTAASAATSNVVAREEKQCSCEACKNRRDSAAEQMEELRRLQAYWLELRQDIRQIYRQAMEGNIGDNNKTDDWPNETKMKELIQQLCAQDPHQLFQRLESQVHEFVIEAKVRQLELLHREEQTPSLAKIFLTGLLEGYLKLCLASMRLAPLLQQLETEHLRRFGLTWEVLNKHLYQSCVYTDPLVQNNLPVFITQLRTLPGQDQKEYRDLVLQYLAFADEMTHIGTLWRDIETRILEYNNEQATLKAKQRMLREDWELFKAHRKFFHQQIWKKNNGELCELAETSVSGCPGPRLGPPLSCLDLEESEDLGLSVGPGGGTTLAEGSDQGLFCPGCSVRRCPCVECSVSHMLSCCLASPVAPPSNSSQSNMPHSPSILVPAVTQGMVHQENSVGQTVPEIGLPAPQHPWQRSAGEGREENASLSPLQERINVPPLEVPGEILDRPSSPTEDSPSPASDDGDESASLEEGGSSSTPPPSPATPPSPPPQQQSCECH